MDQMVARLNVEYFRHLLMAREPDETKRQMIVRLLAEEEEKLKTLTLRALRTITESYSGGGASE